MHRNCSILVATLFLIFITDFACATAAYYAVRTFEGSPLHGSIFSYQPKTSQFSFFGNFSFHIDDNDTDLYYFEPGPVAVINKTALTMYLPIQCGTAFQRLFLLSFNMEEKTYKQSQWILDDGDFYYLFYDPLRQRLFGLRDVSTFTLILEEYNMTTLNAIAKYTQQDGMQYSFPYRGCAVFDYEENWIVEVRTQYENLTIQAYYIKMDLNLVGKKDDIVTGYTFLRNVYNLCSMTYDIKTKRILGTWQNGSIELDLLMFYMDPYTAKFTNKAVLLRTPVGYVVESVQALFDEETRQVLFVIEHQQDNAVDTKYWVIYVEFDTLKIISKKQITKPDFDIWELFMA